MRRAAFVVLLIAACGGSHTLPDGAAPVDADVVVDASDAHVLGADAGPPVSCTATSFPEEGQPCDPNELPDGYVCRQMTCLYYCLPTCHCESGRWSCPGDCRDFVSDGGGPPPDCGDAPVCRETCF